MKIIALNLTLSTLLLSAGTAAAQSDTTWDKSYTVAGQPSLFLSTGDSHLNIHACTSCQAVHIHVTAENTSLSRYTLEEDQTGNTIHFSLKERPHMGVHVNLHSSHMNVDVETPANLTLDARSADGTLTAADLHGDITIHTSDGSQELTGLSGNLKLHSSDGHLRVRNASGTLEARSSDGNQDIAGAFTSLQLHTSDGSITLELAEGSHLSADSRIESSDGSVTLKLPKSFPAELAVSTSDGSIQSTLPLVVEGYNSKGSSGHNIRGKFNGGGSLLTIHTSDGSVHLTTL
jgi:Putative adhesin